MFHRLLLLLPPEWAHTVGKAGLRLIQRLLPRRTYSSSLVIRGKCSLRFLNRVGLAAGFDKDAELVAILTRMGFGFLELGTVTPRPQKGNSGPRLWRVAGEGLINRMGFNSCGALRFREHLRRCRAKVSGVPFLVSLGKNRTTLEEDALLDYIEGVKILDGVADGFVLNISSPNTPGLRNLQSENFLEEVWEHWPSSKPVWIKFAPDLSVQALDDLLERIRSLRITGVILSNTSRALAQKKGFEAGGYSGPELFEANLERVARARKLLGGEASIIAVGGIDSPGRARQVLDAGADLFQVYTALVYQGPELIRALAKVR